MQASLKDGGDLVNLPSNGGATNLKGGNLRETNLGRRENNR